MANTLYTGDNLYILNGTDSESVDLIYLDPPFNSKRIYSAPIGSKLAGASFKDMWTWQDVNEGYLERMVTEYPSLVRYIESISGLHSKAMMAYVTYMTQRIVELHRILKPTGSLYLHVDPTASHYLKLILDEIFGKSNFRNEIIWCYTGPSGARRNFPKKKDTILWYSKGETWVFNRDEIRIAYKSLHSDKGKKSKLWGTQGALQNKEKRMKYIQKGKVPEDWWADIPSGGHISPKERTGYPTQKPLALLERIIKASSQEGDVVLDPFCGCATTCVKAQQLGRKWIGIDIETKAAHILIERLSNDAGMFKDFVHRTDIPQRRDVKKEPPSQSVKEKLFKTQKGTCNGCNTQMRIVGFEIDHIIPKSKGGGDYYENYQLLCGNCNRTKGDRPMDYLRAKIKKRQELLDEYLAFGK